MLVAGENVLDPLEQFIINDTGHTARRLLSLIEIIANVPLIVQHPVKAVFVEGSAQRCGQLSPIQVLDNIGNGLAAGIPFIYLPDNFGFLLVHIVPAFRIHLIAQTGIAAIGQTLLGVDFHASANLLGELCRVILSHTLQHAFHQDTAGIIADILPCGDYPHAILFQLCLVDGAVVSVAGKTVKLIYKNALKGVLVTVGNHPLKLNPAVSCSALGTVNVLPNNEVAVVSGILIASLELPLDGLLRLAMTGVAGIDDNIHCFASPSICSSVSLRRAFMGEFGSKHISTNFFI